MARLPRHAPRPPRRRRLRRPDLRPLGLLRDQPATAEPDFTPKFPILFSEKEGKIAQANRGRDPLHLFAALERQLGYPEVPRPRRPDAAEARIALLEQRVLLLENRFKSLEAEGPQDINLSQFAVKPEDTAGPPTGWGIHSLD